MVEGTTATDLVLKVVEMLRQKGVVGKFVEFYGDGPRSTCRSPTARPSPTWRRNMARPAASSRSTAKRCATCATPAATKDRGRAGRGLCQGARHVWRDRLDDPVFTDTLELDMGDVVPAMAGPKRPQDRVPLSKARREVRARWPRPEEPE
jgi:aconitate hydratase